MDCMLCGHGIDVKPGDDDEDGDTECTIAGASRNACASNARGDAPCPARTCLVGAADDGADVGPGPDGPMQTLGRAFEAGAMWATAKLGPDRSGHARTGPDQGGDNGDVDECIAESAARGSSCDEDEDWETS